MRGVNILGIVVGAYFIYRAYTLVKAEEEDVLNFLIWLVIGSGLVVAGSVPAVFNFIMDILGMQRRAYAMFSVGIFVAYLLLFRLSYNLRSLKRDISKLNEDISLLKERIDTSNSDKVSDND